MRKDDASAAMGAAFFSDYGRASGRGASASGRGPRTALSTPREETGAEQYGSGSGPSGLGRPASTNPLRNGEQRFHSGDTRPDDIVTACSPSSLARATARRTSLRAVRLVAKRAARFGRDGANERADMDGGRSAILAQKVRFFQQASTRLG